MGKIILEKPTLILCAGIPCSGKTTVSRKLVERITDSLIIDKDSINRSFLRTPEISSKGNLRYALSGPKIQMTDQFYHDSLKLQSYHCLLELSRDNLLVGKSPFIDAPYVKEIQSGYFKEVFFPFFEDVNYTFKLIFCHAPEEVIKQRMINRNSSRDEDKLASEEGWRRFLEMEPILPNELDNYNNLKLDTDKPMEKILAEALKYILS